MQFAYADDMVVTLDRDRAPVVGSQPVKQSFILTQGVDAKAVLLLFPGGGGKLRVASGVLSINAQNFLLRSRHFLAAQGFNVAVMDAASDFLARPGGLRGMRRSYEHMSDVAAVVAELSARYEDMPVWLVGTSRGTIAAANAAAVLPAEFAVDGLVLTASVTRPSSSNPDTVFATPLEQINVPTLILHHAKDECAVTVPQDVKLIKQRLSDHLATKIKILNGGLPALADSCDALTAHGFFGIEKKATRIVSRWIHKNL